MAIGIQSLSAQRIHTQTLHIGPMAWDNSQMYVFHSFHSDANQNFNQTFSFSQIGKRQQFQLGQFFRRRYRYELLGGRNYSPELVYVQSTGVDRTLMSASANLAGLFPPAGTEVWHENIAWQPIPVYSMPTWMDGMLAAEADCPRHLSEFNKVFDSPEIRALNKRFKPLYDYLSIHSGRKVQTLYDVENLHNTLYIESIRNLT